MINSIHLKNFQSHKDTELEFEAGVNAIIGSSDSGKSAVLRALNWAVYNRPTGDAFVSHWNRDEKGNLIDQTSVTIMKGKIDLSRIKDKTSNRYRINENSLNAIGVQVPEDAEKFFNLSDVNIQKQLDSPFLLSETSGEIARFLNSLVKLDTIDITLSSIEKKKRENNSNIKNVNENISNIEKSLEQYNWIEIVESLISRVEKLEIKIKEKKQDIETINNSIIKHTNWKILLEQSKNIIRLESKLIQIENIQKEIKEKKTVIQNIYNSIENYNNHKSKIKKVVKLCQIENQANKSIELKNNIKDIKTKKELFANSISQYKLIKDKIEKLKIKIENDISLLPDICPLCGNRMGEVK